MADIASPPQGSLSSPVSIRESDSDSDQDHDHDHADVVPFLSPQSKARRKTRSAAVVDSDKSDNDDDTYIVTRPPVRLADRFSSSPPREEVDVAMSVSPEPELVQYDELMRDQE